MKVLYSLLDAIHITLWNFQSASFAIFFNISACGGLHADKNFHASFDSLLSRARGTNINDGLARLARCTEL